MDRKEADAIVGKMKEGARANPWVPLGAVPPGRYHRLPDGLSLCFTLDVMPEWWVDAFRRVTGLEAPELLRKGGRFWHLSIARPGAAAPTPAEVEFWRRAFFDETPLIQTGGVLPGINSRHFYWKASQI